MPISVGVVGTGWVGASVAISTLHAGFAERAAARRPAARGRRGRGDGPRAWRRVLHDGVRARRAASTRCCDTDALVIAAGRGGKPDESRLDLLRDNATTRARARREAARLSRARRRGHQPGGRAHVRRRRGSGLPPERVIGTGTMLDTARLRQVLGAGAARRSALGARAGGRRARRLGGRALVERAASAARPCASGLAGPREREQPLATEVRTAAYEIIRRKGATNHAIGLTTAALLRSALRGERRVLTVSRVQTGALGLARRRAVAADDRRRGVARSRSSPREPTTCPSGRGSTARPTCCARRSRRCRRMTRRRAGHSRPLTALESRRPDALLSTDARILYTATRSPLRRRIGARLSASA